MNYRQMPPLGEPNINYSTPVAGWDFSGDADGSGAGALDIRAILLTFWRRKLIIAAATISALALAYVLVHNIQPRYSTSATVIFEPQRLKITEMQNVVDQNTSDNGGLQNQVEILRSSSLLGSVADALALDRTPQFNPALREAPTPLLDQIIEQPDPMVILRPQIDWLIAQPWTPEWLRQRVGGWVGENVGSAEDAPSDEERNLERRRGIVQTLNENLRLTPLPGSSVIQIGYSSTDPNLAASIVNTIGERYIDYQIEAKREDVAAVMDMMSNRVADLENRLSTSQQAVEQARISLTEEQGQSPDTTKLQLDTLNKTLADVQLEKTELQGRYDRAAKALDEQRDLWVVTEFREAPTIVAFRQKQVELRDEIIALQAISGHGEGNPQLTILQARLDAVTKNIQDEARFIVAALAFELTSKDAQERELSKMVDDLEVKSIQQAKGQLRIDQLEREAQANQTIYESFLARMKEISEQAKLQTSDARFLSRAEAPQTEDHSSRNRLLFAAGSGGLLIGLALALLLEHLDVSYRDPAEIQERTRLQLLAAIPQLGRRKRPKQLIAHLCSKPNGALAESIRNLRTSVLFSNPDASPKVLMFTSSVPEEGKSTTALLLAVTSQQMGRSAILVDCDFRRQTLAKLLSDDRDRPGLVAHLEGRCTLDEALLTEPKSGLQVLAQGVGEKISISPADVLASPRFLALIEELRARFDLVVLDTPPALAVTDARLLARLADSVVYLVRWNHTSKNAVREGLRELTSMSVHVAGVAFTLVRQSKAAKYSNNEYFYRRRYGSYTSS